MPRKQSLLAGRGADHDQEDLHPDRRRTRARCPPGSGCDDERVEADQDQIRADRGGHPAERRPAEAGARRAARAPVRRDAPSRVRRCRSGPRRTPAPAPTAPAMFAAVLKSSPGRRVVDDQRAAGRARSPADRGQQPEDRACADPRSRRGSRARSFGRPGRIGGTLAAVGAAGTPPRKAQSSLAGVPAAFARSRREPASRKAPDASATARRRSGRVVVPAVPSARLRRAASRRPAEPVTGACSRERRRCWAARSPSRWRRGSCGRSGSRRRSGSGASRRGAAGCGARPRCRSAWPRRRPGTTRRPRAFLPIVWPQRHSQIAK